MKKIREELIEKLRVATNKLILLDYDGTLVNYSSIPDNAVPTDQLLDILLNLSQAPKTRVIIITGRKSTDIDKFLGHLPVDIVAEHGGMIKENLKWKTCINDDGLWKNNILLLLNDYKSKCPGAFIEEKNNSIAWHYRKADNQLGFTCSRKLINELKNSISDSSLKIIDGNKVVEIIPAHIDKGKAVSQLLKGNNYEHILAVGDDTTDEDMFKALSGIKNCYTIKVGEGITFAEHTIENVKKVLLLLKQLI